jgi:uncharacterized metal-binding protein YceD (DUF177 family)
MFDLPIQFKDRLYTKYGQDKGEGNEEVMIIKESDTEIDLSHYVYESIQLCLPYKKIHPVDINGKSGCNKKMMEKLKDHTLKNENKIDPRWDKLKDIIE